MKSFRAGTIWCMWLFWTVYVRSNISETSYRCKRQDGKNVKQTEPLYSLFNNNLISCAVTCWADDYCRYFVYTRHSKLCRGYNEDVCDAEGDEETVEDVVYQQTCKKRCPKKRAKYELTLVTWWKRPADSKADLMVEITGQCGGVFTTLKNGENMLLVKGLRSTFKFVGSFVCRVYRIAVAFADACDVDDWFVAKVVVKYEEMATGDRHRVEFETNYWLSASVEDDQITGIVCDYVRPVSFMFIATTHGRTECKPSRKCENTYMY